MKCVATTAAAVVLALSLVNVPVTEAMPSYLQRLPNGDKLTMELGHPGMSTAKFSEFAIAFSTFGAKWGKELCQQQFPGAGMTNGAAFGDPCCTWTKPGDKVETITGFTTKPTKTTCPSAASPTPTPTPGPSPTTMSPTPTPTPGPSPSTTSPTPMTPSPSPSTTAPSPSTSPSSSPTVRPKCTKKTKTL